MLKRLLALLLEVFLMVSFSWMGMMHHVSVVAISWRIREIIFQWKDSSQFLAFFKDCSAKDWCQRLPCVPSCQPRINKHNRFLKVTFITTEVENKNVKKTVVTKVL